MINRRILIAGAGGVALSGSACFRAQAQEAAGKPPSIDDLTRIPQVRDASISPDGKQLAVLARLSKGDKRVAAISLSPLPYKGPGHTARYDMDIVQVLWAKNDRLLVYLNVWEDSRGNPSGINFYGYFIPIPSRRVVAMDPSGQNIVGLFNDEPRLLKRTWDAATVVDLLPSDERRILMQIWDGSRMLLHYVDVYTGESTLFERGNYDTDAWITQNGVPILRQDSTSGGVRVYGRAPGETDWKLVRRTRRDIYRRLPDFDVVGSSATAGVVLVCGRLEGDNTKVVREFDLRTLQFGKVVASHPKFDLDGVLVGPDQRLLASAYYDDRLTYDFRDPELARHHRAVNTFFGGRCNVQVTEQSRDSRTWLCWVTGPTEPGSFHVYDLQNRKIEEVGAARPWIDREQLAPTEILRCNTRDGASITCYLTAPPNAKAGPLPMVVMPHGGPEVRDRLDFDPFVQALAAQGWLVLQPNFRGSGGYGLAFADQGRRHWGDRMQEDVEDAVQHVVSLGRADPKHLAIMGLSYGGYAALMGAILKPDLYKAVVAGAADADLFELLAFARRDGGADSPVYAYWQGQVGDPKVDKAIMEASSPARRAEEMRAPVLLIHGTEDGIVTPNQAVLMTKALKKARKTYEFIELKGEGHSGWSEANTKMVLERSVAFIKRYI